MTHSSPPLPGIPPKKTNHALNPLLIVGWVPHQRARASSARGCPTVWTALHAELTWQVLTSAKSILARPAIQTGLTLMLLSALVMSSPTVRQVLDLKVCNLVRKGAELHVAKKKRVDFAFAIGDW